MKRNRTTSVWHAVTRPSRGSACRVANKPRHARRALLVASLAIATVLVISLAAYATAAEPFRLTLADTAAGALPPGWTAAQTGEGKGSVWRVVDDATAPGGKALAQVSPDGPNPLFNLCVADRLRWADVDLSVSLRAIAGAKDQGGGPVWRYQDAKNYYVARINPLENNYRVYKVVAGKRTQLATVDVTTPADRWHTLRIVHRGDRIQCYLGGKLSLDVRDATIAKAGKIGLWTKADAQTRFAALAAAAPWPVP